MSTITININSDDVSQAETGKQQDSRVSVQSSGDGGAPKFESDSASSVANASLLDIGGPPQWLTEALSKEGKATSGVSASGDLQGIDDGDAGAARVSFN